MYKTVLGVSLKEKKKHDAVDLTLATGAGCRFAERPVVLAGKGEQASLSNNGEEHTQQDRGPLAPIYPGYMPMNRTIALYLRAAAFVPGQIK